MNKWMKLAATVVMVSSISGAAFAQSAQDAAYDKRNGFVADTNGNCVRTKWMGAEDPCNPAQAPAPVPVAAPAPAMPMVSLEQRSIYFDFDSAALTAESVAKLDGLAQIINASSAIQDVRIHGFTDQFGTSDYNTKLAGSRAAAVKSYLDGKSRLSTTIGDIKGIGKSAPEAQCEAMKSRNEKIACMAKERRVEIEFKAQR
ncbi:MAG: hypothetical protein C0436_02275 [Alphaproteobacteria bacterium]|nr:hypothetical protein [Alphaproteobacteria bacterium]